MNWMPATKDGSCENENIAFAAVGISDVATVLTILISRLPMLKALQFQMEYKMALLFVFGLGIVYVPA